MEEKNRGREEEKREKEREREGHSRNCERLCEGNVSTGNVRDAGLSEKGGEDGGGGGWKRYHKDIEVCIN